MYFALLRGSVGVRAMFFNIPDREGPSSRRRMQENATEPARPTMCCIVRQTSRDAAIESSPFHTKHLVHRHSLTSTYPSIPLWGWHNTRHDSPIDIGQRPDPIQLRTLQDVQYAIVRPHQLSVRFSNIVRIVRCRTWWEGR